MISAARYLLAVGVAVTSISTQNQVHRFEIFRRLVIILSDTVDGWNPVNSPVEVGSEYPIIYDGFYTSQVFPDFWTINSMPL